jgi:PST family polysaccharide transporter
MNLLSHQIAKLKSSTHPVTRAILKAMGVFGSVNALTMLCSLVRNKLIAIWIGPSGVGLVALYNSLVEMISTSARLNVDQSAIRDIAAKKGDEVAVTATAVKRWAIILGSMGSIVICIMSPWLSTWSFGNTDRWWAYCLLSLLSLCYAYTASIQAILQGQRQFGRFASISVVTALVGIVVSVPLIYFLREDSIIWLLLTYGISSIIGVLIYMPKFPHMKQKLRETWRIGSSFVRLGIMMTLASLMGKLFSYLFILYINRYASTVELGLFQAGYTVISNYVGLVFSGIWVEYFPRMSAIAHSPKRSSIAVTHQIHITTLLLMPLIAIFIGADQLVLTILYDNSFMPMLPFMTIGIISVIPTYVSWCIAYSILAKGDGKIYFISETSSGIIGLILNVIGYSTYGFVGLGISYIVWYLAYTLITNLIISHRYGMRINPNVWKLMWLGIAFGAIAVFAKFYVGWWLPILMGIAVAPYCLKRIFH